MLSGFLSANGWLVAWAVVPVLLLELSPWPSWRFLRGEDTQGAEDTGTRWIFFFGVFFALFGMSTMLPALNREKTLQGYDAFTPRDWLGLGFLNDIPYQSAQSVRNSNNLTVVLVPPPPVGGATKVVYREELENLIYTVYRANATGVAFDFVFDSTEWTQTPPNQKGWYWWRFDANEEPQIKHVIELAPKTQASSEAGEAPGPSLHLETEDGSESLEDYVRDNPEGEWYGPVRDPQDNQGTAQGDEDAEPRLREESRASIVDEANARLGEAARKTFEKSGKYFRVFIGYDFDLLEDERVPKPNPRSLVDQTVDRNGTGYFGRLDHGHAMVFKERSGKVRAVGMGFAGRDTEPALSVRIAEHILTNRGWLARGDEGRPSDKGPRDVVTVPKPRGGLLYFVPPEKDVSIVRLEDMDPPYAVLAFADPEEAEKLFRNRFVLIGTDETGTDMMKTPFHTDPIPGVLVQAYAVEALLQQNWITRAEWWYALLGGILPCLSLASRFSRERSLFGMALSNVVLTAALIAVSSGIMFASNVWIDVSYAIFAIWAFYLLGLAARPFLQSGLPRADAA